jgi:hypothetical protein
MLLIGIEQEFVFADEGGHYLDADNTPYETFSSIVDRFPAFDGDDAFLGCKSLERFPKRCYVEGFERHDENGSVVETIPKGLEIRTLPHASVSELVNEFRQSYAVTMDLAGQAGLFPVLTSRHPFKNRLELDRHIGQSERAARSESRLELARRAMLSHGLHVNVSVQGFSAERMQDLVEKVRYYTPSLIPWSYSSPFYEGGAFEGLCARNYFRAGSRSMADADARQGSLVLEFRGFDACSDAVLLSALLQLFCGFVLDDTLPGRSQEQDVNRLMRSALTGFNDPEFRQEGAAVLNAARAVLGHEGSALDLLSERWETNESCAAEMKRCFARTGSIMECITGRYAF